MTRKQLTSKTAIKNALDSVLDHYTGEIIDWLKANDLYEYALNNSSYGL